MRTCCLVFATCFISVLCFTQSYYKPNDPYAADLSQLDRLDSDKVKQAFKVVTEFGIPFKYPQGGCESRAYAMGLLLDKAKIKHSRVWIFAPSKFTENNTETLHLPDGSDSSKEITWSYHTAPVVLCERNQAVDTLVLDPSLNTLHAMTLREWFSAMGGSKNSRYSFVPPVYFMYYTSANNNLLNGNFYEYVDMSYNNMLMERNLALDFVGRYLNGKYVRKWAKEYDSAFVAHISLIVNDIYNLENYLLYNKLPVGFALTERELYEKYPDFILDCKNVFNREFVKWHKLIKSVSRSA